VLIEDGFTVRTPVERLWATLLDVERIAPCLPGAELTETVDERTWKGVVHVRFGPVQLAFRGSVVMEERDDDDHRVTLGANGTEHRGKGAAHATVTSWLEPAEDGATIVRLRSDITITGAAAQLSRGLLPEVSRQLVRRFAACLETMVTEPPAAEPDEAVVPAALVGGAHTTPATPEAVGAIGLGLRALWARIRGVLRRLFGRPPA
jgi:carbon monoxide dehydrogenase subunit G